jgi:hypothetical protein
MINSSVENQLQFLRVVSLYKGYMDFTIPQYYGYDTNQILQNVDKVIA